MHSVGAEIALPCQNTSKDNSFILENCYDPLVPTLMQTPIYLSKIDFVLNYLFFEQQSGVGVACHQLAGCS
jgi:hypothetical protein